MFRQLTNCSPQKFYSLLREEAHNFIKMFATDNVDTQVKEIFIKCLDACAPIVAK